MALIMLFIDTLGTQGIDKGFYEELRKQNEMEFRWLEKNNAESYVAKINGSFGFVEDKYLIKTLYHYNEFDEAMIKEVYSYLKWKNY